MRLGVEVRVRVGSRDVVYPGVEFRADADADVGWGVVM